MDQQKLTQRKAELQGRLAQAVQDYEILRNAINQIQGMIAMLEEIEDEECVHGEPDG